MAVRSRGGSWQVDITIRGTRYREDYPTQVEAIKREAELKVAEITGQVPTAADKTDVTLTLEQLCERVIARVWAGQKAEKHTAYLAGVVVRELGPRLAVSNLTTPMIDDYIGKMEKRNNSNGTINRKLAVLSRMLRFAKTRQYITTLPHIERKSAPKNRQRYLTPEEEAKLLALCKLWSLDDMHDLIAFLVDTGARIGEALKLEWSDVSANRVTFRDTKNGTTRSVPLTQRVIYWLAYRQNTAKLERPFKLDYQSTRIKWARLRDHLGFAKDKDFVIHMLRHTCASRLIQRGAQLHYVKEWLGHKRIEQTLQYAHLAPGSLDNMVALLEQQPTERPRHLGVVEGGQA